MTLQHPVPPSFLPYIVTCCFPSGQPRLVPALGDSHACGWAKAEVQFLTVNPLPSVEWSFLSPEFSAPPHQVYRLNSQPGFRLANFLLSGQLTPLQMRPSCRHGDSGLV